MHFHNVDDIGLWPRKHYEIQTAKILDPDTLEPTKKFKWLTDK